MKRLFDIIFSSLGLLFLGPLLVVVAFIIKLDSPGPVLFLQERIGKNFRPFSIYKFRSMSVDAPQKGPSITVGGDKRVTRVGKFLRRYKIDELPQLINLLRGEMSYVGPRPAVRQYVELFRKDYEKLLTIRPGITDPASIHFSDEENVLSSSVNWEETYMTKILPEKIRLAEAYVDNHTILTDIRLIVQTFFKI